MTVIASEIDRFNRLSATWWDPRGPMRPLHVVNALRLDYVCAQIAAQGRGTGPTRLDDVRVLDVGCGGGLLSEPLARRGARVTGIDAAEKNIRAARLHAQRQGVPVEYRIGDPATALSAREEFDVVLALEVVEHVEDPSAFVRGLAGHVSPGGLLIASTIDRTWKSFLFAIVGAEYVFRVLPRGTHTWRRFVRPAELEAAAADGGLKRTDLRGMRYLPVLHRAAWRGETAVNYIATFAKVGDERQVPGGPQRS